MATFLKKTTGISSDKSSNTERPPLVRRKSFIENMHESISHPFHRKPRRTKSFTRARRPANETNIFASDIVSTDFVLRSLQAVLVQPQLTTVEIEDYIVSSDRHKLLVPIQDLLLADKRKWEQFRFVDAISASDFLGWSQQKRSIMKEYEEKFHLDTIQYKNIVSFQANVMFSEGAPAEELVNLLREIHTDAETGKCFLSGSSIGGNEENISRALSQCIQCSNGLLKGPIQVNLISGWFSNADKEATSKAVKSCIQRLENVSVTTDTPQDKRAKEIHAGEVVTNPKRIVQRHKRLTASEKSHIMSIKAKPNAEEGPDYDWELGVPLKRHKSISSQDSPRRHAIQESMGIPQRRFYSSIAA